MRLPEDKQTIYKISNMYLGVLNEFTGVLVAFLHTKPGLGYKTLTNGGGLNRYPILKHLNIQKEPDELTPSP